MDLNTLQTLGEVSLGIPAWQMGIFLALVSLFMLQSRIKLGLIVTYLFVLYWGFILHGPSFVATAAGIPWALTLYVVCGMATAFLTLLSFFYQSS